jgi:hypothetical protein
MSVNLATLLAYDLYALAIALEGLLIGPRITSTFAMSGKSILNNPAMLLQASSALASMANDHDSPLDS